MKKLDLTFDELLHLVDKDQLKGLNEKKIAQLILDAERDWSIPVKSLNDFIVILQQEVNGEITKSNLEKLIINYNRNLSQNAWEAESLNYILETFDFTDRKDLNGIFSDLIERNTNHNKG